MLKCKTQRLPLEFGAQSQSCTPVQASDTTECVQTLKNMVSSEKQWKLLWTKSTTSHCLNCAFKIFRCPPFLLAHRQWRREQLCWLEMIFLVSITQTGKRDEKELMPINGWQVGLDDLSGHFQPQWLRRPTQTNRYLEEPTDKLHTMFLKQKAEK